MGGGNGSRKNAYARVRRELSARKLTEVIWASGHAAPFEKKSREIDSA
jgi:hypothetical protein